MTREIQADYCIAGVGIAGVLLASRLAAAGRKIVMLDQGPRFSEADRERMLEQGIETLNDYADYNDQTREAMITPHSSAKPGNGVAAWAPMRLFGIGGTALHFEGLMIRPQEEDLRVKSLYGYGRDWPITYGELEPWLLQAEQEVGVAGTEDNPYASRRSAPFPLPGHAFSYFDREILGPAFKRLGITGHSCPRAVNSIPYRGRMECMGCRICKFCPTGARYSPDRVHVPKLDKSGQVTILEKTSLRRLETDPKGNRVVVAHGLEVETGTELVVRARRFVLALGGVETPRMLLLSAKNGAHRDGLGNIGGQLGRNFSDHFNPYVTMNTGRPVGSRLGFETMASDHFRVRTDRRRVPGFMLFGAPAMDWFPIGNEATAWATKGNILSLKELRESVVRIATLAAMTELGGRGTLELDRNRLDAFGAPVAKITMKLTDWDRRSLEKFAELVLRLGDAMGAANISEVSPELGMGYHPSGATAMARTPAEGVCDPDLKVFGLDNHYLVSNSVFPHMGANPPTLTIAALALRLAAHLEGGTVS